ncbi:MAG: dephospho-CoA kinase [Alphaproteobacteria bacterium]|nr:dephospho-CoA kinase [Alphaproteobacteria bacterium]
MFILGLTGSIGSGKSEAAKAFRALGCPVFDGDAEAHRLLADDPSAIFDVAALVPSAVSDGVVDRRALADHVFASPELLMSLESVLHPKILASAMGFLDQQRAQGAALVVLEMPLLFETGIQSACSAVAVVTVSADVQDQRVMACPGMTAARLATIRARQLDPAEKAERADYILDSMTGKEDMVAQVNALVTALTTHPEQTD